MIFVYTYHYAYIWARTMVTVGTFLYTCDNSGARLCKCIKILGNRKQPGNGRIGDKIVVSVQRARSDKKIKKHDVHRGVLVRSKRRTMRPNGLIFSSSDNAVILLDKKNNPLGTRIFGAVSHELRIKRFVRIISMASAVI
jgi:large subunit ribosomal protein L14